VTDGTSFALVTDLPATILSHLADTHNDAGKKHDLITSVDEIIISWNVCSWTAPTYWQEKQWTTDESCKIIYFSPNKQSLNSTLNPFISKNYGGKWQMRCPQQPTE